MATLTLGKVRPVPKGAWSSSVTYEAYDWVTYKESAWLALVDVPKNYEPDSHPTVWVKFGAQGEQGEQGVQGVTFTPYIKDGYLYWENDGGLDNPEPVYIKGPAGTSPLSDSVTSTASDVGATSKAVKSAYDRAAEADNKVDAIVVNHVHLTIAAAPGWFRRQALPTPNKTSITIPAGLQVNINNVGYISKAAVTLSLATVATAANRAGKDIYIYACAPSLGNEPTFVLSMNSTVPSGYTADNSRKIGGFHCLCANVGTISGHPLSGYVAGDILPLSVWDLLHRPVSDPEGMVWVEGIGKWVDIYLASWTGAKFTSAYGATISDGASSPAFHGEKFAEYAGLCGKRLTMRDEFIVFAKGSNENTNIKGSTDPNTTGGHVDTASRRMVSNYGIEDCCGALWQWGGDTYDCYSGSGISWNTDNFYLSGYAWQEKSVYNPSFDSQKYGSCAGLLRRVRLGAYWSDGSDCGSRASALDGFSSNGWSAIAVRLVAEPRVVNL